ncbi:MAG: aminotransferase class I/II-fold pyridoxal phosphate-dependent enzyme [Muribaculaceae bacterium]|nr:aminotransferase class I/II-fold pyridoxal phosphate-dependent enzyme [Muribaculaceae bacterium]
MQALILAAGMGRRLGEKTRNNTKCMIEVNGVKLIDRVLRQLKEQKIDRVVIVAGYCRESLMAYVGDNYDGVPIHWVVNPIYDKTNNIYSLALAKDELVKDDTLLIESDLIFDDSMFDMILSDPYPNLALVAKYETWMDGTMVRIDSDNNIVNFVPKKAFNYDEVDTYYKTVNIYKFSREFSEKVYVPFLEAYCRVMGNNEYYEQVLRVITLLDGANLKALPIGNKRWYEIDDVQDLDIAQALFAEGADRMKRYFARYGGYWRFPQLLDFCYLVNPYFPPKRMKDELRANFDVLLTEYPSGMRVNSMLAGKYFGVSSDYIIVGNGAAELIKSLTEIGINGKMGVVYPTFEEYPNRIKGEDIVAYCPEKPDWKYDADDLIRFYGDKPIDSLLLVNPDNPTGNYIVKKDVLRLLEWCENRNVTLVLDESFVDFSDEWETSSLLSNSVLEQHPKLIVVKSISKSFGVPGLRLGVMASGNVDLISAMKKDVAIWNINSFAEFYMQIFNKYEHQYREACARFVEERNRFEERLRQVPHIRVLPSQANFFTCVIEGKYTSTELTELLLSKYEILIKDGETKKGMHGTNTVRIAIRDRADNDYLCDVLMKIFS